MNHHSFVHEANAEFLSELGDNGLGGGEALAVQGISVRAIVQNEDVVGIGLFDRKRVLRLDDESSEES